MPSIDFDLGSNEVHLFYTCLDAVRSSSLVTAYEQMLDPGEFEKITHILSEKKRHERLVAGALARVALSRCCGIDPKAVSFAKTDHGKPELAAGVSDLPVRFNLSHSGDMAAIAVVAGARIGLDVEDLQRNVNLKLAGRFFSAPEIRLLEAAEQDRKKALFLRLWTLKEAYVKAVGKGLSMGLDRFAFSFGPDGIPGIQFGDTAGTGNGAWQFFDFNLRARYRAALAVESLPEERSYINVYRCIPFESIRFEGQIHRGQQALGASARQPGSLKYQPGGGHTCCPPRIHPCA